MLKQNGVKQGSWTGWLGQMMSFEEFLAEEEQLKEGIIRSGAIACRMVRQSRRYGDEAAQSVQERATDAETGCW